ncbi:MAG: PH domain-containing protein [Tissierella sp.]|uniref:PH domain-containing protein n=1 Tax=Tissierella sp. TaxID=41274 RepID=UPI003F9CF511
MIIRIIMLSIFIFLAWIWLGTYYYISETLLKIKSGPFTEKIPIKDIRSIRTSRNSISSPSLSLDRLQIRYEYGKVVLISPKAKEKFVETILEKNSDISVNIE